jgi:hypothetical protein
MSREVVLDARGFGVEAVHRLALAVAPADALTRGPLPSPVQIGREVRRHPPRRRRPGDAADPLSVRFDVGLDQRGTVGILRHRIDLPLPPAGPDVADMVLRLYDPARRYVSRRLRVPVWSRRRVEAVDDEPPAAAVTAEQRAVRPWLFPGAAYEPAGGTTAVLGRVVRADGAPVPWPRVRAVAPLPPPLREVLGSAHGDDRGEFLLVIRTTGTLPPPWPRLLDVTFQLWVPGPPPTPPPDPPIQGDPLATLAIEDARDPNPPPGSVIDAVIRGETLPSGYLPATPVTPPPNQVAVGTLTRLDPFVLA